MRLGFLTILLCIFAVAPLMAPGYFWGAHDARHSVYFLVEFDRSIQDGILYPRWQPDFNFGYGYPFFNIYSPGAFYLGEAFHLLGLDFVAATKAVFGLGIVLSALAMYGLARRLYGGAAAGLVAGVVYTYIPYHLADIYLRGAQAESFAFVFYPLALWGFLNVVERPSPQAVILAGSSLAGLILSHYGLAFLFLPVLGAWVITLLATRSTQRRPALVASLSSGAVALGLSAILLLPVLTELRFVRTDQWAGGYYTYRDHFVDIFQFFAPTWGYGVGSVAGPHDTLPFQLGAAPFVLVVMGLAARRWLPAGRTRLMDVLVAITLAVMALMLPLSQPIWEGLDLAALAQFPWRLLSVTTVTLAILAGALVAPEDHRSPLVAIPVAIVVVWGSYGYLQPSMTAPETPVSLGGLMRFQQSSGEMTGMTAAATRPQPPTWSPFADIYVAGGMPIEKVAREFLAPGVQAVTIRHTTVLDEVQVTAPEDTTLVFATPDYPGWRATVDGRPVATRVVGDLGFIGVPVPAGDHTVLLYFEDTLPRRLGGWITAATAVLCLVVMVRARGSA